MSEVDDDLSRLRALAETYLIAYRRGATVDQILPHVQNLLSVGDEAVEAMREAPRDTVVQCDAGLDGSLRLCLEKRYQDRADIRDRPSASLRPRLPCAEVARLETEAVYDFADHSRSHFTAFVTNRRDIGEQLDADVTEIEWRSLIKAIRNNPAVIADFAASIIRNHRAFIASRRSSPTG